jgi:5-formyltetrahydrofolate cyclo-ligase
MWQEGHPDVIVIPGRVFDIRGGRLGRGRGHYDRLLTMHSKSLKIGVCFDVQLVDKVPMEEWDIPMDRIFS